MVFVYANVRVAELADRKSATYLEKSLAEKKVDGESGQGLLRAALIRDPKASLGYVSV